MPAIIWNIDMHLGIPELDASRQTLVEIVNRLDEAMREGRPRDDLATMLKRFAHVAREYIVLERRYLLLHEDTDTIKNKREDAVEEITIEIIDGLINYLEGGSAIDQELLAKITAWLLFHLEATRTLKSRTEMINSHSADTIQGE